MVYVKQKQTDQSFFLHYREPSSEAELQEDKSTCCEASLQAIGGNPKTKELKNRCNGQPCCLFVDL